MCHADPAGSVARHARSSDTASRSRRTAPNFAVAYFSLEVVVESGVLERQQPGGEHVPPVALDHMIQRDVVRDVVVREPASPEGATLFGGESVAELADGREGGPPAGHVSFGLFLCDPEAARQPFAAHPVEDAEVDGLGDGALLCGGRLGLEQAAGDGGMRVSCLDDGAEPGVLGECGGDPELHRREVNAAGDVALVADQRRPDRGGEGAVLARQREFALGGGLQRDPGEAHPAGDGREREREGVKAAVALGGAEEHRHVEREELRGGAQCHHVACDSRPRQDERLERILGEARAVERVALANQRLGDLGASGSGGDARYAGAPKRLLEPLLLGGEISLELRGGVRIDGPAS
jgi:hypothetical protein